MTQREFERFKKFISLHVSRQTKCKGTLEDYRNKLFKIWLQLNTDTIVDEYIVCKEYFHGTEELKIHFKDIRKIKAYAQHWFSRKTIIYYFHKMKRGEQ